jgi:glutamyl-tRNA reductase
MSNRQIVMIGAHQRTTPIAIRERLAFGPDELATALTSLSEIALEVCILSTCNRMEIYAVVTDSEASHAIVHFLADHSGLPQHELAPTLRILHATDVVQHVYRLAAGLDSMVLGEDQIVAQIKQAMAAAQTAGTLGQILSKLLQSALASGKTVRSQTGIARSHLSVVSVALDMARQSFGTLSGRRVLIIGAGQTAELALKHIKSENPAQVTIANRTPERAAILAERHGAQVVALNDLGAALCHADVILSCTAAPQTVITSAMVAQARTNCQEPLLLLDLAVPHDIERAVAQLPGVKLFNVDDLQAICVANRANRAAEITHANTLVEAAVGKFMEWWGTRLATPTIRALRERAEAIRIAEVQRTLAHFPQLPEREQAAIQALSEAIVNKLLHPPISSLKANADAELIGAARQLFQVEN